MECTHASTSGTHRCIQRARTHPYEDQREANTQEPGRKAGTGDDGRPRDRQREGDMLKGNDQVRGQGRRKGYLKGQWLMADGDWAVYMAVS